MFYNSVCVSVTQSVCREKDLLQIHLDFKQKIFIWNANHNCIALYNMYIYIKIAPRYISKDFVYKCKYTKYEKINRYNCCIIMFEFRSHYRITFPSLNYNPTK